MKHLGKSCEFIQQLAIKNHPRIKQKLWSGGIALGSRSEGRGFDPCPMLDGSGVKAMPGSMISAPNSGSVEKIVFRTNR